MSLYTNGDISIVTHLVRILSIFKSHPLTAVHLSISTSDSVWITLPFQNLELTTLLLLIMPGTTDQNNLQVFPNCLKMLRRSANPVPPLLEIRSTTTKNSPTRFACAEAAAALINAAPEDVALISSVGYGVSTAAKVFAVPAGSRVLVLQDDHSSAVLEWITRAGQGGFTVETIRQPDDGDWTASVLAAIERPGAAPIAIASISSVHWSDGGVVDLHRVAPALRAKGAALLIDATHSVGVLDVDVEKLDPDFVAFPTYKWLIGPYARAFLYVAKRHQGGIPLEQTSYGRRAVRAEQIVYFTDTSYVGDARRFDMGERDHFISMEMAAIGMEMMAQWGRAAIVERLAMLTARLAEGLRGTGVNIPDARMRAPLELHNGSCTRSDVSTL